MKAVAVFLVILAILEVCNAKLKKARKLQTKSGVKDIISTNYIVYSKSCETYTPQPYVCVSVSGCGWCSSSNACIAGTVSTPTTVSVCPSAQTSYVYEVPVVLANRWDPFSVTSTHNVITYIHARKKRFRLRRH